MNLNKFLLKLKTIVKTSSTDKSCSSSVYNQTMSVILQSNRHNKKEKQMKCTAPKTTYCIFKVIGKQVPHSLKASQCIIDGIAHKLLKLIINSASMVSKLSHDVITLNPDAMVSSTVRHFSARCVTPLSKFTRVARCLSCFRLDFPFYNIKN